MPAYQNVSTDGTTVTLGLGGNPAITYTSSGAQFTKNKLINGEVTRINQRAFNGTWSGKSVWETQPATIAGKEAAYGYDMWFRSNAARSDGTGANENMAQWIESGNYRPSTVHTLSGTGVTTVQVTSPASGDWKIVVAQGATNVQVEEGTVATPFELRSIRYELAECQRYFQLVESGTGVGAGVPGVNRFSSSFLVLMRYAPVIISNNITVFDGIGTSTATAPGVSYCTKSSFSSDIPCSAGLVSGNPCCYVSGAAAVSAVI